MAAMASAVGTTQGSVDEVEAERLEMEKGYCNPFKLYDPKRIRNLVFATPSDTLATATRGKKRDAMKNHRSVVWFGLVE